MIGNQCNIKTQVVKLSSPIFMIDVRLRLSLRNFERRLLCMNVLSEHQLHIAIRCYYRECWGSCDHDTLSMQEVRPTRTNESRVIRHPVYLAGSMHEWLAIMSEI